MSLACVLSRASVGIDAPLVRIEVHLAHGLPAFNLVGLAETAVRESRDRVRSALLNSGFEFPAKRITVNLAPADLPKEGGRFDLPIAIGILAASGLLPDTPLEQMEMVGELALDGQVRPISGALTFNYACQSAGHTAYLPSANCAEASLIQAGQVIPVDSLQSVFLHLSGQQIVPHHCNTQSFVESHTELDITDIIGQTLAKRALEIAAAGNHSILMVGQPGTGKTMMAQRLITLLPPMDEQQALETARIYSVAGHQLKPEDWRNRPFRSPHHTSSAVALVGGGSNPRPGEISLAHNGVLFLDELPEFPRRVLDVLREPLEAGKICISRAAQQVTYPAQFQLVAAMNPSPTGDIHDGRSTTDQILRYLARLSGPLLDRIDLQVDVPKVPSDDVLTAQAAQGPNSAEIRQRVALARQKQIQRVGVLNGQLNHKGLQQCCQLTVADQHFLQHCIESLNLSMRAYHRIIKLARTIADLQNSQHIKRPHLHEAMSFRAMDNLIRQLC